MHISCLIRPSLSISFYSPLMPFVYVCLLHLYAPFILIIYFYLCFTYFSTSNYSIFVLINCLKAFKVFNFDFNFVIASAKFKLPLIHFTFIISCYLYAKQRHIILIINCFSCVITNLTKHLYKGLIAD